MNLAVIPARGGSKRVPGKNLRDFCGRPIISYSIACALESGLFDRVVISTDSERIAEVAMECGAEAPFLRPSELSDDHTPTRPVLVHAVEELERQGGARPEFLCCIYPTAPFLEIEDLRRAFDFVRDGAEFAFAAASFPYPIQRAIRINREGRAEMFQPEHLSTRSQDLEEAFHDAGQFYWGRTMSFLEGRSVFDGAGVPVVLPRYRVHDIDTEEDWESAERMYRALQGNV